MLLKAVTLKPDAAHIHDSVAKAYFVLKKYDSAIRYYQMAKKLDPQQVIYYTNLAKALLAKGAKQKAVDNLNQTIAIDPTDEQAKIMLQSIRY